MSQSTFRGSVQSNRKYSVQSNQIPVLQTGSTYRGSVNGLIKGNLKLTDIPSENGVQIIDNYSNRADYIIYGPKVYISDKGSGLWRDISDNNIARKNLLNFLNDKYNFTGYNHGEKDILDQINKGTFDYNTYSQNAQNSQNSQNSQNAQNNQSTDWGSVLGTKDFDLSTYRYTPKSNSQSTPQSNSKSNNQNTSNSLNNSQQSQNRKFSIVGPVYPDFYKVYTEDIPNLVSSSISKISKAIPEDYKALGRDILSGTRTIQDAWQMYQNKKARDAAFKETDPSTSFQMPEYTPSNSQYGIIPQSFVGDTIPQMIYDKINNIPGNNPDDTYILPQSIDLGNTRLGYRNRNDYTPLTTEGGIVTAFNPFLPYDPNGKYVPGGTYIGLDKNGKFKFSTNGAEGFQEGDVLTRTYSNDIVGFKRDANGKVMVKKARKNPDSSAPIVLVKDANGNITEGSVNLLTDTWAKHGSPENARTDTYGRITGGSIIVSAGGETRLLTGSIDDVANAFDEFKNRHEAESIKTFVVDNGNYNRGLRTYSGKISSEKLRAYDNDNAGGGNFLYIHPEQYASPYSSDTIRTPNVRTEKDESYKKGHSLTNEQKGIVLHHTAFTDNDPTNALSHMLNPKSAASAHVLIGYDGKRYVMADPNQVTFHAGQSIWNGRENANDFMVGIEFQGDTNKKNLTPEQIASGIEYMEPIIRNNKISLEDITTHQVIRDLWLQEAAKNGVKHNVLTKPDINQENYQNIVNELLGKIYYKKGETKRIGGRKSLEVN